MRRDKEFTKVIFRKSYWPERKEWEILAFFPQVEANAGMIMSYAHLGQHGEACLEFYRGCRPALPREYAPLKKELERYYGYRFKVARRITRKDLDNAWRIKRYV